jgi:DNA polymerase-3 subunit alpha
MYHLSEETGIGLVATNDAHYLKKEDAEMQDVLICVQTNKTVDTPDRMRMGAQEFYLKSEAEMRSLFPNHPEAVENTAKIAARCNVEFQFGVYHLPEFKHPEGLGGFSYLERLCREGFSRRYPEGNPEYESSSGMNLT